MDFNTRSDTKNFLNVLYMNLMEKLLERVIAVTELDDLRATELRRTMLKPMLFHVVEDIPLVVHEYD